MKNTWSLFTIRALLAWLLWPQLLGAANHDIPYRQIPEALKAWESWVTWGDEHRGCPTPYSDATKHLCFWPSRLGLQAEAGGGKFDLGVLVFHETWVPLPGQADLWPVDVRSNGEPVVVVEHDGKPAVRLPGGSSRLEGSFRWKSIPQRLAVPPQIGVLALSLDRQPVEAPVWDAQGFVWLKRDGSAEEADKNFLAVKLYAVLEDGLPLWWRTEVELTVAGKSREEDLGTILPEGWKLASVDSPIPAAVDEAGRLKAQVRAGKWTVRADAFRFDRPTEFHFAAGAKPAMTEELVAFRAKPDFRVLEVTGAPAVDVSQTTLPEAWRGLPAYRWDTATPLHIEERLRGMGAQKPAGLSIARELWLDEDGGGLTFRDRLTGAMQQTWRLDAAEGQDLGSVRSGGQGQFLTRNPANNAAGLEIRTRNLDLEATGRLARAPALSATGWRSDADSLQGTLHLPPGWRLFALFGADWVKGDWLTAWTLLDLFLLLIFTLAVHRLWGFGAALIAFLGFGLSYHEPYAPRYLWLVLLVPLALQRVVPAGWGRRLVLTGKWIVLVLFAFVFVGFIALQVQQTIYPQLEIVSTDGVPDIFGTMRFASTKATDDFEAPAGAPPSAGAEPVPALLSIDATNMGRTSYLQRKLDTIIIPRLEFRDASLEEAIEFLRHKSAELDITEPDTARRGINIILQPDLAGSSEASGRATAKPADARINVALTNVPIGEALRYVANLVGLKLRVEDYAVRLVPLATADSLVTREWKVASGFLAKSPSPRESSGPMKTVEVRDYLTAAGITFPPGSSAIFFPGTQKLIVKNTQENLDLIDYIVAQQNEIPVPAAAAPPLPPPPSLALAGAEVAGLVAANGNENLSYDPKARIQTGPGVPEWTWREVSFGWNGPVSAQQRVRPWLISLGLERVLAAARVALLLALAAVLLGNRQINLRGFRGFRRAPKVVALLAFLCMAANASAQSSIPDSSTLEKLRQRLLEAPDAFPTAADIPSATLTLSDRKITIDAEIHAAVGVAVPLPGRLPTWSPLTVLVDDKPETALRRDDGYLWVLVPTGVHHVRVEGSLANVTEWEWTFLLKPHQVKIDAPDWTVTGVKPTGAPEAVVFFARKQKAAPGAATYERQEVQAIAQIERTLELGLIWQVHSTVRRLTPVGRAVALRVPLLPGENVLTPAVVKEGFIEVRLGAQEQTFSWDSGLAVAPAFKLATRVEDTWVEHWRLVASPVWNVTLTGLPPVFEPGHAELTPVWQPWPGEGVELAISRPEALAGATVTVRRGAHAVTLGERQRTSNLELSVGCSVGQDFLVTLPEGAEVTGLRHNDKEIPVRRSGRELIIPVHPGEQKIGIAWKTNVPLGALARADEVRLPVESANIRTSLSVPQDRWVLWVGGPRRGPAVRFWGILACSLLAAVALGRVARTGISTLDWMLLAVGLTQVPLPAAMAVILWLFFLAWRGSDSFQQRGWASYNFLQVTLIVLTAIALGILVTAVSEGLLGRPEMFIVGPGSSGSALQWSLDRSGSLLPQPGCLTVSIWWYRFLMLGWALWLAAALLRWLRRGWQDFGRGGFFRGRAKRPVAPPVGGPPPLPSQPASNG